MCPGSGPPDFRLPPVLEHYLFGLRNGSGTNSPPSRSTIDGATSVLKPIVLSLSRGTGLKRFLTALATIYALKEARSGEHMVTLSWGLERAALKSLIEAYPSDGDSDEIVFELSIQALAPDSISQNPWSREQMFGISGGLCDHCKEGFSPTQGYMTICYPPSQLKLYHSDCGRILLK